MKQSDDTGLFVKLIAEGAPDAHCVAVPQEQVNAGSGEASIATGFPPETFIPRAAGGVPPRGQDMNGFLNRLSHSIRVLQSGFTPKFDAAFANAIGGYPAGAVVSGLNVGNYWVSATDNNLSTPGASGATWQSLFSDYVTQSWADGRYVHNNAGVSGGVIALDLDGASSGKLAYQKADKTWANCQPAGDYATSAALNDEVSARGKADNWLQEQIDNRVIKDGDTMTGTLTQNVGTSAAVIASGMSGPATAGQTPWTPQFVSKSSNDGSLQAAFCARDRVGYYPYLSIQFTEQNGTWHELQFRSDNRLYTDNGNKFALTTELPTSGTIPGGIYTKTGNILQQHFTVGGVVHVDSGFWVSFPVAYSQTPQAINLTANVNGDMDVAWFGASPTGFFICIPYDSATSNQPVSILVSGIA